MSIVFVQPNIRNMSVIAHVDHGKLCQCCCCVLSDPVNMPRRSARSSCFQTYPAGFRYESCSLTGKSTLTDSLVAAAGIIAMENVSRLALCS